MKRSCDGKEHLRELEVEASPLVSRSVDGCGQSLKKNNNQSNRLGLRSGFHPVERERKQAGPVGAYAATHPMFYHRMGGVGG